MKENEPVILKNSLVNQWPAMKWSPSYLESKVGHNIITSIVIICYLLTVVYLQGIRGQSQWYVEECLYKQGNAIVVLF